MAAEAPRGSVLERAGVRYLQALASRDRVTTDDPVHVLTARERSELKRVERAAIARAALAGALSGLACAVPAILLPAPEAGAPLGALARYWGVVLGVIVVASVLEILYLYRDGLQAVHELARAAGLDLGDGALARDPSSALWSLARAALELPNPQDGVPGVNPLREASRLRLVVVSTVYKLKVALTGFLAKALLRRALGRAATRAVLELLAVPVTALWDALVCWLILREARLRVLGPSAALEFTALLLPPGHTFDARARACAVRAVGAAVVRTQDLHPNLVALLRVLREAADVDADALDDSRRFLDELRALDDHGQSLVLRTLAAASILDGRIAQEEARLLREAFDAAGVPCDLQAVERLRRAFVSGDPIPRERLDAIRG
jgi:hypothetical protein